MTDLFTFGLLYNHTVTLCNVQRRTDEVETYHIVVFNGKEYEMRLKDDMCRFTSGYMDNMLRSYEDYLTNRIFSIDM